MSPRRRRPETAGPRSPSQASFGTGYHPATLVAWAILLVGILAFARAVYRQGPSRPEPTHGHEPAPGLSATPGPRAIADPVVAEDHPEPKAVVDPARSAPPEPAEASAPQRGRTRGPVDLLSHTGPSAAPPLAARSRPRVAIIIDDVGADLTVVDRATRLPHRLTFAVIPHLPHSKAAAEMVHRRGHEVMLHLPMEPVAYPERDPGRGAVRSSMSLAQIRQIVLDDLASVPHVRGVNNHMGSRITADPVPMAAVVEILAETPYYFVDSRTTSRSVAYQLARRHAVPTAERSVFLDDTVEPGAIRRQFRALVQIARRKGQAIAIGHPHPATMALLPDELDRLVRAGIELVFASELVS